MKMLFGLLWMIPYAAAMASNEPVALVYRGPGACANCWKSAAQSAKLAGFDVVFVNEKKPSERIFERARLWVQPGGKSKTAALAMGSDYLSRIRRFVFNGGGYVGFCAGMFLSTEKIGTTDVDGLKILPGRTELWDKRDGPGELIPIAWKNEVKSIYHHGGPFIDVNTQEHFGVKIHARYEDGRFNAVSAPYGYGRVAVTGSHPEASRWWKFSKFKKDRDGSDQPLVVGMMKWATQQSEDW